jgi:flagellar motor component MotA
VTGRPVVQTRPVVSTVKVHTQYALNLYRTYQYILLSHNDRTGPKAYDQKLKSFVSMT